MSRIDISDIKRLPLAERVSLIEDVWDSIAEDSAELVVPDWHIKLVQERIAKHRDQPDAGTPWPEVRKRIEQGR